MDISRPHFCSFPDCSAKYTDPRSLRRHISRKHSLVQRQFQCLECPAIFQSNWELQRHKAGVHERKRKAKAEPIASTSEIKSTNDQPPLKKSREIKYIESIQELPPSDSPLQPTVDFLLAQGYEAEWASAIHAEWSNVRTKYRKTKLSNMYQVRLQSANLDIEEIREILRSVHTNQTHVYKLQIGYTVLLHQQKTSTFRVYWASNEKLRFFPTPPVISNSQDLEAILLRLLSDDIEAHLCQQFREDTSWKLVGVLAAIVTTYSLGPDHPLIGALNSEYEAPPAYIKNHRWIKYLDICPERGKPYGDKLCLFRSIAFYFRKRKTKKIQHLAKQLMKKCQFEMKLPRDWDGAVKLSEIFQIERILQCRIFIYELVPKDDATDLTDNNKDAWKHFRAKHVYSSGMKRKHAINGDVFLNIFDRHLSPIKSINQYAKTFLCAYCKKVFKFQEKATRHQKTCSALVNKRAVYKGGNFQVSTTIFDRLEEAAIVLKPDDKYSDFFAVWDTECLLIKMDSNDDRQPKNDCLQFESVGELVSVAVNSNIPIGDFNKPIFFRRFTTPSDLMGNIIQYFLSMAEACEILQKEKLAHIFEQLNMKQKECQQNIDLDSSSDVAGYYNRQLKLINKLEENLEAHTKKLVLYSFNGARFDMKLCRDLLIEQLFKNDDTKPRMCIKRNGAYTLLTTEKLIFRDFAQLLPPATSLDKFLKSQSVPVLKSIFPYDWMDCLQKLEQTDFPPIAAFYNTLTKQHVSTAEYTGAKQIFDSSCSNMWDYLKDYNIKDVDGFVPAIESMKRQWKQLNLCITNDGVSLSALAYKLMHRSATPKQSIIWLPRKQEKFVFDFVSRAIIGGPSICFTRFHMAGNTSIRKGPEKCQSIIGEDCNSLYLWAIAQDAPAGIPVNWELDKTRNVFVRKNLVPPYVSQGELEFVLYKQHELGCGNCCKHHLNGGQIYIGYRKWKPDFVCLKDKIIWLFNGCWIHAHSDPSCPHFDDPHNMEIVKKRWQDDQDAIEFYTKLGFTVNIKWQCEWEQEKKQSVSIQNFLNERISLPLTKTRKLTESQILSHVKSGKLFGLVTLDLAVSKNDYSKFAHYPPFFVHKMIERRDLCPPMLEVAEKLDLMRRPVKSLVSVMQQKQMTVTTPLLKWYLEHGIDAKNITSVIQFKPVKLFEGFASEVTKHRKAADVDKDLEIIGTLWKNCGNSSYGKTLERRDAFVTTKFCDLSMASALVNSPEFLDLDEVSDFYEMTLQKKKYHESNAKTLGAFILAYAKLRMLEFVYDYLQRFWPDTTYELCGQDTDSCYYATSAPSRTEFEKLVKPELRKEFEKVRPTFIATEETKRDIGLFKLEWEGFGLIYLGPKSYACFDQSTDGTIENCTVSKFAAKGVSRKTNNLTMMDYLSVLRGEGSKSVENRGFMFKAPNLFKYSLSKRGLVNFFYKRRLDEKDPFKTLPLLEHDESRDEEKQDDKISNQHHDDITTTTSA